MSGIVYNVHMKTYTARKPGTKAVRLDLTEIEHHALRQLAARLGLPMSQAVRAIVLREVRKINPK